MTSRKRTETHTRPHTAHTLAHAYSMLTSLNLLAFRTISVIFISVACEFDDDFISDMIQI